MKKLLLLTSFLLVTFMVSAKVIQISVKPSVAQLTAQVLDGGNQLSGANGVFTGQIGFLQEKTLTVKADGFETAQLFVSFKHKTDVYEVVLKPNRKKLVITTNEPNSTIFIDGHDVNTVPIKDVRAACAYVPQDNFLFSDTIENNIAFGVENLRVAFNQVRVLLENGYGKNGEYVGLDVKAMRTTTNEDSYKHLENSLNIFKALAEKAERFDYALRDELVAKRDFEGLEMYTMRLLMGLE